MKIPKIVSVFVVVIFLVTVSVPNQISPNYTIAKEAAAIHVDNSSYLGGLGLDRIENVVTDSRGYIYIVGSSESTSLPTANAFQEKNAGNTDFFVAKLSSDFSIQWLTYVGGQQDDFGTSLCLSPDETTLYISGYTHPGILFYPTILLFSKKTHLIYPVGVAF